MASVVNLRSPFCEMSVIGKAETALDFVLIFFGRVSFFKPCTYESINLTYDYLIDLIVLIIYLAFFA